MSFSFTFTHTSILFTIHPIITIMSTSSSSSSSVSVPPTPHVFVKRLQESLVACKQQFNGYQWPYLVDLFDTWTKKANEYETLKHSYEFMENSTGLQPILDEMTSDL